MSVLIFSPPRRVGNDIYTMWPVAHTWTVSSLSNPGVSPFMSEGEYRPPPLSSVSLWREKVLSSSIFWVLCRLDDCSYWVIQSVSLTQAAVTERGVGEDWLEELRGQAQDKRLCRRLVFSPFNQIFISLIRSEQMSATVANFLSMYLLICQFSRSTSE